MQTGIDAYFKDATFGVKPEDVERTYSPRDDVTVVRDTAGVPHIYGETRAGAMFATGYATAEDRLFFMDVFRHIGRAQLASFAGGSPGNRAFDHLVWTVAPYTEADLQAQIDRERPGFEAEAAALRADLSEYVAGINAYIAETRLNPLKLPAEYLAINRPAGPGGLEGHRHRGHRPRGRGDPRRRRRRRAGLRAGPRARAKPASVGGRAIGCGATSAPPTTRRRR